MILLWHKKEKMLFSRSSFEPKNREKVNKKSGRESLSTEEYDHVPGHVCRTGRVRVDLSITRLDDFNKAE
jgi:hypothetical protein